MNSTDRELCHARNELGNQYFALGQFEKALAAYEQANAILPGTASIWLNIGNANKQLGNFKSAIEAYQQAIRLRPDHADAYFNLGSIFEERSEHVIAAAAYQNALRLEPTSCESAAALAHQLQHLCEWTGLTELTQQIVDRVDSPLDGESKDFISPYCFISLPIPTTPRQQMQCMQTWSTRFPSKPSIARPTPSKPNPSEIIREPIKVGYLSADFRKHAVAYMLPDFFESHDRSRFKVFGYSYGPDDKSPIRQRIVESFDKFRDLRIDSFQVAAQKIIDDGIDILVDLQGYTTRARPEILALRPAPIQVSYLGFPATMGCDFIDYILVDNYVVPKNQQPFFTEKLIHLPGCYQVNDRQHAVATTTPTRSECGLPSEGFVFCSFNNSHKITRSMFKIWMRILAAVPKSVLWFPTWNVVATGNLVREAIATGMDSTRLIFAPHVPIEAHLARHRLADLSLDSFPYNGHATTSISLRMGVPMITLSGQTFASRVAGSLLTAVGLPELITISESEYEDLAIYIANHSEEMESIRKKLDRNLIDNPLFDGRRFAKNIEAAFQTMMMN